MTSEADKMTQALAQRAAGTRARVAADVERLATELEPRELKGRALEAAERSFERIGFRLLRRLADGPRWLVSYVRHKPVVGAVVVVGAGVLMWRMAARRRH